MLAQRMDGSTDARFSDSHSRFACRKLEYWIPIFFVSSLIERSAPRTATSTEREAESTARLRHESCARISCSSATMGASSFWYRQASNQTAWIVSPCLPRSIFRSDASSVAASGCCGQSPVRYHWTWCRKLVLPSPQSPWDAEHLRGHTGGDGIADFPDQRSPDRERPAGWVRRCAKAESPSFPSFPRSRKRSGGVSGRSIAREKYGINEGWVCRRTPFSGAASWLIQARPRHGAQVRRSSRATPAGGAPSPQAPPPLAQGRDASRGLDASGLLEAREISGKMAKNDSPTGF